MKYLYVLCVNEFGFRLELIAEHVSVEVGLEAIKKEIERVFRVPGRADREDVSRVLSVSDAALVQISGAHDFTVEEIASEDESAEKGVQKLSGVILG